MLLRVALVRTDVSEELSASFIRVTRIGEPATDARSVQLALFLVHRFFHTDEGGAKFLRDVSSYKSHAA
jgi:hypothetical protein